MTRRSLVLIKALVWLGCLTPFTWLVLRAFEAGGLSLGANPVEEVLHTLGKTGLNILLITLTVTPARRLTGLNWLVRLRRTLGLFAFAYLALHFLTYVTLDWGLAWGSLLVDIIDRPYITVGFTALMLMLPLAVTSTNAMQRRLGRNWVRLHRLVYLIAALGVLHFYWQGIRDPFEPIVYAGLLGALLGIRAFYWLARRSRASRS